MTKVDPKDHLDRRYEDTRPSELPDAPVDALRGLGKAGSEALRKAIGVKTIRDLATNQFVLAAQELLGLAEGRVTDLAAVRRDRPDRDRSGGDDDALVRSEEELEVGTERTRRGRAGVRKRVETEQVERTVPVKREELRVEREPIPASERGRAELGQDEQTIELHEERPVVDKQVVPKERLRVGKEVVTDEERVSEEVRKEKVEVDDPDRGRR
jgi:uncharacterized protein (TIGR02271 family)